MAVNSKKLDKRAGHDYQQSSGQNDTAAAAEEDMVRLVTRILHAVGHDDTCLTRNQYLATEYRMYKKLLLWDVVLASGATPDQLCAVSNNTTAAGSQQQDVQGQPPPPWAADTLRYAVDAFGVDIMQPVGMDGGTAA